MNEDLVLLQIRQRMNEYAEKNGIAIPERPIVAVSGSVTGQLSSIQDYQSNNNHVDADLNGAELDFIAEASPWATAAMIISYDNNTFHGITSRVGNSRIQLSRGFVTIGQLDKSPFYGTIGQVYMPFGAYGSYMVTSPWTQALGRIDQRGMILGYNQYGIYAQVYGFRGDTYVPSKDAELLKRGGFNIGYTKRQNDIFSYDVGAGWTGNLAESQGMQATGSPSGYFQGFGSWGGILGYETLQKRVPGIDVHAKISLEPFVLLGEYVTATTAFDPIDLSFNNHGAKPQALNIEAAYSFKVCNKPNTFAIGYGRTAEMLGLYVPKNDVFAMYNVALVKDTIESIEYRHDVNYSNSDIAGGSGMDQLNSFGSRRNVVTAHLSVYF